ncbi:UNVERIFIED_CONTAM: hypothetical protein Scaly_2329400 [Sesamum calycinum]|uniref:DUF642 domain-containing protein n=1 Tax=Sesamum calycinum TaxID=2727403 RepID=A0AAW2MDB3_9LAMI
MMWSSAKCKWVSVLVFLFVFSAAAVVEDGALVNGDFETPPSGGFSSDGGVSDGPAVIPSWKTNGTVELVESGQKTGGMILIVPQGAHAVRLGNDAEISQEVKTIDLQTLYSVQGWDSYAWAFQAEEEDVRVVFRNPGMEDDPTCGPIIDDIAIKKLFVPDKPKGWIVESNRAVRYIDSYHFTVPGGKRAIELLSGKEGIISQMVETKPNKPYRLTFSLGHAGDACKQPLAVMAFAGDQAQNIHYTPDSNSTFQSANVNFTAKAERTRIAFYSVYYNTRTDDMSSLCGPVVDDVRVEQSDSTRLRMGGLGLALFLCYHLLFMVLF